MTENPNSLNSVEKATEARKHAEEAIGALKEEPADIGGAQEEMEASLLYVRKLEEELKALKLMLS